jgi:lipoprotein-anchoring transpeptidase ErfK/SrfK
LPDYYSVLSRAVAALEPNTAQARAQLFRRARQLLLARIRDDASRWTDAEAEAEIASFDAAISRIQAEMEGDTWRDSTGRSRRHWSDAKAAATYGAAAVQPKRQMGRVLILGVAGLLGVLVLAAATYAFRSGQVADTKTDRVVSVPETSKKTASRSALETYELEPGVDGGSSADDLPYFLRRQLVYYRSVYSAGMVVVDRSQRFLYFVLPQSRAVRYAIGIGGECSVSAGLYRIQSKSEWPDWSPSPALRKRGGYPARMPGGPGNPLGSYAMYFEGNYPGIHGTNAPKSIGQAPSIGCLRLVNDDVVDLAKRVDVGTAIVVLN